MKKIIRVRIPTLVDLIAIGIIVLLGEENRDWQHYGCDGEEWWALRRN